jgi:hypothetical protein
MEAIRMDAKRRGTFLVTSLMCALALGVAGGCGGDDNDAAVPPGDGNVRDGTWRITTITESTGTCAEPSDTTVVLEQICNLEDEFEQGLADLGITIDCSLDLSDDTYEINCTRQIEFCDVDITLAGDGEYHDTSYVFDGTATITITETAPPCEPTNCTLTIHEEGVWQNSTAACEDDTTAAPGVFLGALGRLLSAP